MNICHLYDKVSTSLHILNIQKSFDEVISFDISTIDKIQDFDIYVIELDVVDKEISFQIRTLLKDKLNPLVYFIVSKKYNLMLFQLTFLVGTKAIITQNQNQDKLIKKIKLDFELHNKEYFQKNIGSVSMQTLSFMSYKDEKLVYVSKVLLEEFELANIDNFKNIVISQLDISELFLEDSVKHLSIKNADENINYILESISINNREKIIYIEPDNAHEDIKSVSQNTSLDYISSRVNFIEFLSEKLQLKDYKQLSAISINMANIHNIEKDLTVVELEEYLREELFFMNSLIEDKLIFAEYDKDFYVMLFENNDFEDIKVLSDDFHNHILDDTKQKELKFSIDIFSLKLDRLGLKEIIIALNKVKIKDLSYQKDHSNCVEHTSKTQTVITEKSVITDAFLNKTSFKLLNIYNGLVINTPSKIIKQTDDSIYVTFEQLQGVVMNMKKETILQSNVFMQDILAKIKIINLQKKVAVLEDFRFLNTNVNSRKFARVTTSNKIPVTISLNGIITNATILDVSIKSIAMKVKFSSKVQDLNSKSVKLRFNISNYRFDDGYVQLNLKAQVTFITLSDTDGYCKVVCDLDDGSDDDSILKEYVYDRQKELIIEIKKLSKLT